MGSKIHQGHPYEYMGKKVIALTTTVERRVSVLFFDENEPWNTKKESVRSNLLKPLPLRYLNGEYYKEPKPVQQRLSEPVGSNAEHKGTQEAK